MRLDKPGGPLELDDVPTPVPERGQLLIEVEACAVCRTDLHLLDGELPDIAYPIVPGHQVVGRVAGGSSGTLRVGTRVGVPWLGHTCGNCEYCRSGRENLCPHAGFTGYTLPGGFAEYMVADARYCFEIDDSADASHIAPLLCAGMIGYRSLKHCGDAERIGIYGFGAAAHIVAQIIGHQGRRFFAFTRPGDESAMAAARALGARWAGGSDEAPPDRLDAAIIFAPVGALVPKALADVVAGGVVVCGGIHMSDIPSFAYSLLWGERRIESIANLTRADGEELLALAAGIPIETTVRRYGLEQVNAALADLRAGAFNGSAVLEIKP